MNASVALLDSNAPTSARLASFFSAAEKTFVDAYKKAIETSDKKTLQGFLYTVGAHPMALDFYKEMVTMEAGSTITQIALTELTAEDKQKIATQKGPDGKPSKSNIPIVKTLLLPELLPLADFVSVLNVSFFTIGMLLLLGLPSGPFCVAIFCLSSAVISVSAICVIVLPASIVTISL